MIEQIRDTLGLNNVQLIGILAGILLFLSRPQASRAFMRGAGASKPESRWLAYLPAAGFTIE